MKAVILVGGKGTRLGDITRNIPKPMVKIGGLPILEHTVKTLKKHKIKDIVFLTNYLPEIIENYFEDGRRLGVNITYYKEKKPMGTAGGIKEIEHKLTDNFLIIYGDIMWNIDLTKLIYFHREKNSACTLVLHPNDHPYDSDLLETNTNGKIIAFHPKPHNGNKYFKNLVNAGLYVMSPKILTYIKKGMSEDFGKDVFPRAFNKENLYGYNTAEYLKDVGSPDRLTEVTRDYLSGRIDKMHSSNKKKAIFLDRDGVINKKVDLLYKIEDFELIPNTARAIRRINNSEYLAIVVTNQSVVARNLCSIEELEEIHKKMETLLGRERAKLDTIYYCPHHPHKGYCEENAQYKIECDCRKPKIGMFRRAEKEFNIDLKSSFIVGDSSVDIISGKNAGLTTIGVRTGDGCKDAETKPDYLFEDLYEAVDFIMKEYNDNNQNTF